jgi:hypothetical protein
MPDEYLFALHDFATMSVARKDIAGKLLVITDNVYKDPDAVRRFALSLSYVRVGGLYPGRFARVSLPSDPLLELARRIIPSPPSRPLVVHPDYQGLVAFAVPMTKGDDLSRSRAQPHSDSFCHYTAVLYLSRPEDCVGGTSFWRHKRTGLEYTPTCGDRRAIAMLEQYGIDTPLQLHRNMMDEARAEPMGGYIVESNRTWERVEVVEMQQNRLVLYDANLFHSIHAPTCDWVPDLSRPRLTQNLYLAWAGSTHDSREL